MGRDIAKQCLNVKELQREQVSCAEICSMGEINKCTYLGINPANNLPLRTNFHTNGAGEQDVGCS